MFVGLEKVFSELATADGELSTQKLSEFFQKAGMYPTKREIDAAFKLAFKGWKQMIVIESEFKDTYHSDDSAHIVSLIAVL